jgi:hypothetical protein
MITLLPGCAKKAVIPQQLAELSLVKMWDGVIKNINVQAASEELGSLRLHANQAGKVESLSFDFYGTDNQGKFETYSVDINEKGEMNWNSRESKQIITGHRPIQVFTEIDKPGLSKLEIGSSGLEMLVEFQSGSFGYSHDYLDVYRLENGVLQPLQDVIFHSDTPRCIISVFKLSAGDAASVTNAKPADKNGVRTSQIWLLAGDLAGAENVEYLQ